MKSEQGDAYRMRQADDLFAATREHQLPPLSARSAELPSTTRSGQSAISRPNGKMGSKLPRTPSVKQMLGRLEAKLNILSYPAKQPESNSKFDAEPLPENQSNGTAMKPCMSLGQLAIAGKLGPAEVQECLRNVSLTFSEVIELLPSYRQLLIRVQETYDHLVTHVLEELGNTTNLRSRLRALSAQLQRLEGGHSLFPAENSWSEACKLRRQLADKTAEHQALEAELLKLKGKMGKQASQLHEMRLEGFRNTRTMTDLRTVSHDRTQRLAERSKALAETRWCSFFTWAVENMPQPSDYVNDELDHWSRDNDSFPHADTPLALLDGMKSASPAEQPNITRFNSSKRNLLDRQGSMRRRSSLPAALDIYACRTPPDQPSLVRVESNRSGQSSIFDTPTTASNNLAQAVHQLVGEHKPERWGITLKQLHEFWDDIKDDLEDYCGCHQMLERGDDRIHVCLDENCACLHPHVNYETVGKLSLKERSELTPLCANMHLVVNRYIKPQTEDCGKSYALMKNPGGRKINVFITHVWSDRFENFVRTLGRALSETDVVWVCSFAMPQNSKDEVEALLDTKDLRDCPFGVALRHAESHVVILDEDAVVPTRSWCTYEINLGSNLNKPMLLWPHQMHNFEQLHDRIEELDMEKASASNPKDEERIKADIMKMGGFEALNKRLRGLLHDRIRFAQDVVLAGKQDREGVMHAFHQKLAKEEEEHRRCQLELAELSQKLQAALDSGNSKEVGEVCEATNALKMDGIEKACWEGIKKLHLMLEYQPLKANATPVHAMQIMCNALVRIHRESDEFSTVDWGKVFCSAFERELDQKGLVNIQQDVIKFIAQVKPPRGFSEHFLPASCWPIFGNFTERHAQDKANELVSDHSIEADRRFFQDRLVEINQRLEVASPTQSFATFTHSKTETFSSQEMAGHQQTLQENRNDLMYMVEVLTRVQVKAELADRLHIDESEKKEHATKRIIEEFRAQIQELEDSKEHAVREAQSLERTLLAQRVDEKVFELMQEMNRTTADRDENQRKLEAVSKQQRRLEGEVKDIHRECATLKEESRKCRALADYWQKEAERLKKELEEQTVTARKFRNESNQAKMESAILKLKPQEEVKTPMTAINSLCNALVRAADDYQLGRDWYDCFQEEFIKGLKEIPVQKEDIENFICRHGGIEFQTRFLSYCFKSKRSRFNKRGSKDRLGERISDLHVQEEEGQHDMDVLSDWDDDDRPASAPDLITKRMTVSCTRNSNFSTTPLVPSLRSRKTTPRL